MEKDSKFKPAMNLCTARLFKERLYAAYSDLENARIIIETWPGTPAPVQKATMRTIEKAQNYVEKAIQMLPPFREGDFRDHDFLALAEAPAGVDKVYLHKSAHSWQLGKKAKAKAKPKKP